MAKTHNNYMEFSGTQENVQIKILSEKARHKLCKNHAVPEQRKATGGKTGKAHIKSEVLLMQRTNVDTFLLQ